METKQNVAHKLLRKSLTRVTFTIVNFSWNGRYPARSFTRIFFLISLLIYVSGRLFDPGPLFAKELIDMLIRELNLELIQQIKLLAPEKTTLWRGSGFALEIQLLLTWPLAWILAISAGWMCRNGSQDFEKYPPIIKKPSVMSWVKNLLPLITLLCIAYYPFYGSNASSIPKPMGFFTSILSDNFGSSAFWMLGGYVMINLTVTGVYVCASELKLSLKKGT
jgi:hypothetical protein